MQIEKYLLVIKPKSLYGGCFGALLNVRIKLPSFKEIAIEIII